MLGNLIVEMKKAGILQGDFAEMLNLSRNAISQKVNGKRDFTASEMFLIKNKFFPELTIEYLFQKA